MLAEKVLSVILLGSGEWKMIHYLRKGYFLSLAESLISPWYRILDKIVLSVHVIDAQYIPVHP